MKKQILAVDPGKDKTGLAVLLEDGSIVEKKVAPTLSVIDDINDIVFRHGIKLIVIGNGGPGKSIEKKILTLSLKSDTIFINEKGSTLEARKLYWKYNKKKWFLALIPSSMILPPEAYDDYAAVVIGKRYLKVM
ncbi:MAG: pre-16S rRNA-processing nuclease YqgF [Candidatus Margulisiibacteriota bacterium]|mgnify:CR=1 FL=1